MRGKSGLLLIVALGCGMVASVGISQVVMEQKTPNATPTVDIFVATQDIDVLTKITAETVKMEKWPEDRLPEGAITNFSEIENKYTNQVLYQGEPILGRKLIDSADSLSKTIPAGHRVFDLAVDVDRGGVGYIQPGDRVDVVGYFEVPGGRTGQGETKTVMRAIRVWAIDGVTVRQTDPKAAEKSKHTIKTIQLLIRDSQAEALNTATNRGSLRVNLCPPAESNNKEDDKSDNGEEFLKWVKDTAEETPEPTPQEAAPVQISVQEVKSREMAIVTPTGIKRYRFERPGELPVLIDDKQEAAAEGIPNGSGNYYGYPVNYPPTPPSTPDGNGGFVPPAPAGQPGNGAPANPGAGSGTAGTGVPGTIPTVPTTGTP